MCKGSLRVTFFSVRMSANFGKFNLKCQGWLGMGQTTPVSILWTGSRPEVDRKWTGSGPVLLSVCLHFPYLLDLMRGIYKRRALAPCDFL